MVFRSIALTTDLAIAATRGRVTDRGDYVVVDTPDEPTSHHGNALVLHAPPQPGEVAYWVEQLANELPARATVALRWDGTDDDAGPVDELTAAGFAIEHADVMIADEVLAPPHVLELRPLARDELTATAELAWAIGDRHDEATRQFLQRRAAWQQGLVGRGMATFWGAFDRTLVASLGVIRLGALVRYQDVQTLPAYRRRGLAGALLAAAERAAMATGAERAVIVASPGSDAARVYRRVGFRIVERIASAVR